MLVGPSTAELADCDEAASEETRTAICGALAGPVEQLEHDIGLIVTALHGRGPEFALSLLVDVVRELPGTLRDIEVVLAALNERRKAA